MDKVINYLEKIGHTDTTSWNWGSIPEWFGAIGTLAAVIVALTIALRDDRRRFVQSRREQAEKISVWKVHPENNLYENYIHIANGSHLPIHDVVLSYGVSYGKGQKYSTGNQKQILVLKFPPGNHTIQPKHNPIKLKNRSVLKYGVAISFRDSKGRFWRRDATGHLRETKQHPFEELGIKQPIPYSRWTMFSTPK